MIIENDANAAAWGEFTHGVGREADDMVLVTVGTGIGGGVIVDGRLLRGAWGVAAELGHLRVVPDGIRCGCGNRGCWEQYASGNALVREARDVVVVRHAHGGSPGRAVRQRPVGVARPRRHPCRQGGRPRRAGAAQPTWARGWVRARPPSSAILDPELIVIGGGVADAGDLLLDPTRAAFRRQLTGRGHRPEAEFALASLGNDAGMIGAAALAAEGIGTNGNGNGGQGFSA